MENIYQNFLKKENALNIPDSEEIISSNEEKKSKMLFNEIIDDLIRKKSSKENMLKIQLEKNKKNLLEKFYSISNMNQNVNQNNQIPNPPQINQQKNIINIPNNNLNQNVDGQKEYDELREKYKNERNKKKSSIFKSEDLHISNTNSVHLKKEDFSPINPNMVKQETKNNILIIQKKLFGDSEINEETSKVENIDEIDDLDFDDIDIKDFKNINKENTNITNNDNNNTNNNIVKMSNSNLDTNNINFDLSSNIKSEIIKTNEQETNYFPNEILEEKRAVEYTYLAIKKNKKNDKLKNYKKTINRTKNFSVQLVSKLDYYREEEKDDKNNCNNINKNRKIGNNREVMNEMNDFIKNLNFMNPNMNNNININNINNNININHANLSEIISQQNKLNKKLKLNNNNANNYTNINYNTNTASTTNTTSNKNNNISTSKKKNEKIENKIEQNYRKIKLNQKPFLNNMDLNLNENQKLKNKYNKINYRHISNSNLIQNKNNITNNQTANSNKRKRKNNSVIINRENDRINNKEIFLLNNNKKKDSKTKINFHHFNTNNNNINHEINTVKSNNYSKNIISPLCKNDPFTTKNKKIKMANIIKPKRYSNYNISTGNKFSTLNTLQKNTNIKFLRPKEQIEVINKLKQQTYLGIYFIYAEKIKNSFLFKGIYKKGVNDLNYACNKIYSTPNCPVCINYEKFYIYIEDKKMDLIQTKLSSISIFNLNKSIILVKNE